VINRSAGDSNLPNPFAASSRRMELGTDSNLSLDPCAAAGRQGVLAGGSSLLLDPCTATGRQEDAAADDNTLSLDPFEAAGRQGYLADDSSLLLLQAADSSALPNPFAAPPSFSSRGALGALSSRPGGVAYSSPGTTIQLESMSATPPTSSSIARPSADSTDGAGASEMLSIPAE
jgi:hypothetical protein